MHGTSSILYKKIYNTQFAYIIPILFIGFRVKGTVGIAGLLSLLLIFSYMSYHVLVLLRSLPGKMPLLLFLAGTFFTVGGSIVDMVSTVMCSPDLDREANYMVLMLLDSHVSLWLIYLFMFCFQILMSIMIIGLWGCFLRTPFHK